LVCLAAFQDTEFERTNSVRPQANLITLDPLGNIYAVNDFEIVKYDPAGRLIYSYSNFTAGTITSIDPSDPFKVLVYYRDFSQVDVLDNTLSRTTDPILFQLYGLELVALVCRSYNSGMWVYNPIESELIRMDQGMQITDRSGFINQIAGIEVNPNLLTEDENHVYLNDPDVGVLVFDKFGTYIMTYPFLNIRSMQFQGPKFIYFDGEKVHSYDTRKLVSSEMKSIPEDLLDIKLNLVNKPQRMYYLDTEGIQIFEKK